MSPPHLPPEIEQATLFTAVIGSEPVVIVLPRFRSLHVAESGELVTADAWTSAVSAHGARPMLGIEFDAGRVPGWLVTLTQDMTSVQILAPAALGELVAGELVASEDWRQKAELNHRAGAGLVVITGAAQGVDGEAALEMMESERAVWVRAHTALH